LKTGNYTFFLEIFQWEEEFSGNAYPGREHKDGVLDPAAKPGSSG